MKVFGVVGSPRKNGNTDILVEEVLRSAQEKGSTTKKVFLSDLDIQPCKANCSNFCISKGECSINDDMTSLYTDLYESDIIIIGTPIYWYGPTAQVKAFIDRWYAFSHSDYVWKMKGKKFVLIAPFEESDLATADPCIAMLEKSLDYLKAELSERILVSVGEKGAIKQNVNVMKRAYNLGQTFT
jgi:multimeric flavodoxin WrbA